MSQEALCRFRRCYIARQGLRLLSRFKDHSLLASRLEYRIRRRHTTSSDATSVFTAHANSQTPISHSRVCCESSHSHSICSTALRAESLGKQRIACSILRRIHHLLVSSACKGCRSEPATDRTLGPKSRSTQPSPAHQHHPSNLSSNAS